jgi:hypothetical protein
LNEDDADPATFFYYLGLAGKHAARGNTLRCPLFTPEYVKGLPVFTRGFFRDLYARPPHPFAPVFDNYQDLGLQARISEVISIVSLAVSEVSSLANPLVWNLSRYERTTGSLNTMP